MPGTKKISCNWPLPSRMFFETVDPVIARAIGHHELRRRYHMDEARIAAARRGIDAAVGAGGGEHAERRHRDEFCRVRVDLGSRFRDHARRGRRINRGKIAGGNIGQWNSPRML